MAEDNPVTVGKRFLELTATLSVLLLLLSTMPTSGSAEQRPFITGNSSLCSGVVDGDGGCLAIARAQPELEGFEMSAVLGSGVALHRSLLGSYGSKTGNTGNPKRAGCGRNKPNSLYSSCTTDPRSGPPGGQKCSAFTRGHPC